MNDQTKTFLAMLVELGLPLTLVVAGVLRPAVRMRAVVVLGAVSPLLLAYAATTATYFVLGKQDAKWSFHAMWLMSFIPFVACAALGAALAMVPVPKHALARYLFGFVGPSVVALLVAVGV